MSKSKQPIFSLIIQWSNDGGVIYILHKIQKIFTQCIAAVVMYASETWNLPKKMKKQIRATQMAMGRKMLGVRWEEKRTNASRTASWESKMITASLMQLFCFDDVGRQCVTLVLWTDITTQYSHNPYDQKSGWLYPQLIRLHLLHYHLQSFHRWR